MFLFFSSNVFRMPASNVASKVQLSRNNECLIYNLLLHREVIESLRILEHFASVCKLLSESLVFFDGAVLRSDIVDFTVDNVLSVLAHASRSWQGVHSDHAMTLSDVKFSYEEQLHAEEFFLQYIWTIIFDTKQITWNNTQRIQLFSVAQHEAYNGLLHEFEDESMEEIIGINEH